MSSPGSWLSRMFYAMLLGLGPAMTPGIAAAAYKILHSFNGAHYQGGVWGGVVIDHAGNVYGTNTGAVFELTLQPDGDWSFTTLHSFSLPGAAGLDCTLVMDSAGNLYGSTVNGGPHDTGSIFELSPSPTGWSLTTLHYFGANGRGPYTGVIIDQAGDLYGAGPPVFRLSKASGKWRYTPLYDFPPTPNNGWGPLSGLARDSAGNLFGTTEHGGGSTECDGGCGTLYALSPQASGPWTETIPVYFGFSDNGSFPEEPAILLADAAGNIYGTALGSLPGSLGIIYRISPLPDGTWQETILYNLTNSAEGQQPTAGVIMDKAGNLYGTTIAGGDPGCECGVVFELSPGPGDTWAYTVLHAFTFADGAQPDAPLALDDQGNIYGTTAVGGPGGLGVVFEITP